MAKPIETLSIQLKFTDAGSQAVIDKVRGSLKRLQLGASGARPSIKGLRDEILAQGRASVGSVSNINAQRTALMALRDEAKIGGNTFKQLTADIKKLDAQLAKTSKRSGGVGARRATQTAGAIISGGIFGGPEGAIGGALGAFGGVEGAFAGAAIGAQVGMLRQAVGDMADYAATIEKAKIALNGVLPSQNDFNFALQVASQATKELNVPQDQSIRGMTRLAAAVTGAKGPVTDAALTFRNVTAAIKATGGSSEDVQGAITAMVQVFSKGKVSAEELSGQLGERLPGAVTMFAKANKMTLPELQKNLKAGTVGLNELMNFIVELGNKYNSTASKISDSNAEAGARLSVAIRDMQADVGAALIPIGAQFQTAFAEFIKEITPHLVEFLPKIGKLFLGLAKNIDTVVVAALAALGAFGIAKLVAIATAVKGITGAVAMLKNGMVALGLANPFTAIAVTAAALAGHIYTAAKEQKRLNALIREGTAAQIQPVLKQKQQELDALLLEKLQGGGGIGTLTTGFEPGGRKSIRVQQLRQTIADLQERLAVAPNDETQGADLDLNFLRGQFSYEALKPEEGGTGSSIKDISSEQLAASLAELKARQKIATLDKEGIELKRAQFVAQRDTAIAAAKAANAAAGGLEPNKETLTINKANATFTAQNLQLDQQIERQAEKNLQAKQREEQLILRGRLMAGEITQEQFDQKQQLEGIQGLLKLQPELYDKIKKRLEEAATPLGTFRDGVKKIFEEAMNLNQALADRGVQAVQQFGDAFADFVATGKSSFAELTQSILQDLSRIFARAALFQGLSLIPGVGDFLKITGSAKGNIYAKNKIVPFAYGGIVNKPTLFPMANGAGLMGEAGPEAIMPLRRGRGGKLGVEASGGVGNVVVNVDASGSRVQGDQPNAKALGSAIGAAVQAEIVRQKRPGGLLS